MGFAARRLTNEREENEREEDDNDFAWRENAYKDGIRFIHSYQTVTT